ncbi:MAG: hypothetical protein J5659_06180 [Clostridia bacterium]|nr:hypothetical protein [Clostridia bacterium]
MEPDTLKARVDDCVSLCGKTDRPKFLGFLNENETALAAVFLKNSSARYKFFGGYDLANRRYLGVFPEWDKDMLFPIKCITFTYPSAYSLTHRDFLGAVTALGVVREAVGDILIGDGRAVIFVSETIAEHIVSQISKVGSVGVKLNIGMPDILPEISKKVFLSDTIASNRLDCVISAFMGTSRGKALSVISEGRVSVNSMQCQKITMSLNSGDSITVRGKGRFTVESMDGRSKKGRIILKYSKYA